MLYFIKHIEIEGPGIIQDLAKEKGIKCRVIDLYKKEALPERISHRDKVVILGGPMNVYEEEKYPFLREEDKFIKLLVARDIPTLGICLGAQLIAKAAGGKVVKAEKEELGYFSVSLTPPASSDRIFRRFTSPVRVFQWHGDKVVLPPAAVLLAGDEALPQAFRLKSNIYALQFHWEVNPAQIKDWIGAYIKEEKRKQEIEARVEGEPAWSRQAVEKQAEQLAEAFFNIESRPFCGNNA